MEEVPTTATIEEFTKLSGAEELTVEENRDQERLKGRIKDHYDKCSTHYHELWGQHIHHGYWKTGEETKERAQEQLIELLLERSQFQKGSKVLDVGCGVGGTSIYLATQQDARVTGITLSPSQVEMATKFAGERGLTTPPEPRVQFLELDAEKMDQRFEEGSFDVVWISEAMSHLPNKALFFRNAFRVLKPGGKLVVADWFKASGLTPEQVRQYIHPIEVGMLLPPLCSAQDYVDFALQAGFKVLSPPFNISSSVSKTWDISWELVQKPGLWKLAFEMGRDFIAFLKSFQAMRTGFSSRTFEYNVLAFEKQ